MKKINLLENNNVDFFMSPKDLCEIVKKEVDLFANETS